MGTLTKAALDDLIAAGCPACGHKKLGFQTYVDGIVLLMAGEPVKSVAWVYKGIDAGESCGGGRRKKKKENGDRGGGHW